MNVPVSKVTSLILVAIALAAILIAANTFTGDSANRVSEEGKEQTGKIGDILEDPDDAGSNNWILVLGGSAAPLLRRLIRL